MLTKFKFKNLYNSKEDNLITSFYIPALENSIKYDRISSYFDSKILRMYSVGIEHYYESNGKIRFVFSCDISEEDYQLMKKGYELREYYKARLMSSLCEEDINVDLSNMAYLIAKDMVDVKIAFTKEGIFHDKYGLFMDEENNALYFRGSNNETLAAVLKNYESFETSCTWECDLNESFKIQIAINNFEKIWSDKMEGIITLPLPQCVKNKLLTFSSKSVNYVYHNKENALIFDISDEKRFFMVNNLENPKFVSKGSKLYAFKLNSYVEEIYDKKYFFKKISYIKINELIKTFTLLSSEYNFNVYVTPILRQYIFSKDILIDKRKNVGIAIKHRDDFLLDDFNKFKQIVNKELSRQLREPQMWDAYHIATMIKSANFSVPGAGKTSIVYGAYAYLSFLNKVDKIVMIGPKNSFSSWKKEFINNFASKRKLEFLDIQESERYGKRNSLKYFSNNKNLILINYESTLSLFSEISQIIDDQTLLVFDEVHRIKGVESKRAEVCLKFSKLATYKVVLTGTPIPNSYKDIFNLLNILYSDEYDTFFNFRINELSIASKNEMMMRKINNAIYPFFCRITKKDLLIPLPYEDDIKSGMIEMDEDEEKIMEIVYNTFGSNTLLLYIRLMQASSNPDLILKKINISDFYDDTTDEDNKDIYFLKTLQEDKITMSSSDFNFIKSHSKTRKIDLCAELIKDQVNKGQKVIAWGIFVDNLFLLSHKLTELGLKSIVISGSTPQHERDVILDDFERGLFDVLITNPHTLAESISLHKICHYAIYFEYSFNLTHMIQSRDRIHRLGITELERPQYTYMFLNSDTALYNTIDKKVYYRLKEKEKIMIDAVEGAEVLYIDDNYMDDIEEILYNA